MIGGKISPKEFDLCLAKFQTYSDKLLDDWKIVTDPFTGIKYASKTLTKLFQEGEYGTVEFHIVYSVSYQVPILYVRVFNASGRIFTDHLKVLLILAPSCHLEHLNEVRLEGLTQQMHPILQTPFYQLHPCHTENWMEILLKSDPDISVDNYLVTWLSFVGPYVGLYLCNDYSKLSQMK